MEDCSMRTPQLWLKQITKLGLILMMGVSMNADAGLFGFGGKSWKEEVLLHDGSKIIVERVQKLGGRPTLESRERAILDETITFSLPGSNQKISWAMSFRDDVPEPNGVNVVLLGIVNNVPYIAGYPAGCIAYNKWKRPNPPQILFKFDGDQWKRVTLAEFPLQLVQANVIVGGPPAEGIKHFYTVEQVNEENHDIDTPEYRTILRVPVKRGAVGSSVNCEELVYYKGAWVGPGDSIGKRMMDSRTK
ncbi:MAG: hypothetical protein PHG89_09595 [Gallionella sp.]|nr:hypothetical protein [Gallionella sp.]